MINDVCKLYNCDKLTIYLWAIGANYGHLLHNDEGQEELAFMLISYYYETKH